MSKVLTEKQRLKRDERILKLYNEKGLSTRAIAEKIGLSKTRVAEITKNYELV